MQTPQVRELSSAQINHIYHHFEQGIPLNAAFVKGVRIMKTFSATMGRYVDATATGCRLRTIRKPV